MSKAHCKTPMLPEDFNGINETDLSVTNEDNKNLKETWNVEVKKRERTKQKCDKNQQSCSESGYKVKKNETYVCGPCSTQFKTLRSLMKHKCNLVTNDDINGHAGEKYSKDSEKQSDPGLLIFFYEKASIYLPCYNPGIESRCTEKAFVHHKNIANIIHNHSNPGCLPVEHR